MNKVLAFSQVLMYIINVLILGIKELHLFF